MLRRSHLIVSLILPLAACTTPADPGPSAEGTAAETSTETDATTGDGDGDGDDATGDGDGDDPTGDGDGENGDGENGDGDDDPSPAPQLPEVTGTCPTFVNGDLTFNPVGADGERQARIWMDPDKVGDGRLQFWFHGTTGSPDQVFDGYGEEWVDAVVAGGGIVVAPFDTAEDQNGFPWWLLTSANEYDLFLMDEIVACAAQEVGIDTRRIHSAGYSAGGMHSAYASFRRSSYLASVVSYSGGLAAPNTPPDADPNNKLTAMAIHGGVDDTWGGGQFYQWSHNFIGALDATGRLGIECDHGMQHTVYGVGLDAERASIHQFFEDHPYGAWPSPYTNGLPTGFAESCISPRATPDPD